MWCDEVPWGTFLAWCRARLTDEFLPGKALQNVTLEWGSREGARDTEEAHKMERKEGILWMWCKENRQAEPILGKKTEKKLANVYISMSCRITVYYSFCSFNRTRLKKSKNVFCFLIKALPWIVPWFLQPWSRGSGQLLGLCCVVNAVNVVHFSVSVTLLPSISHKGTWESHKVKNGWVVNRNYRQLM